MTYERDDYGKWVLVEKPTKSYRSYSKWHLLHEGKSDSGRLVSMCGQLTLLASSAEVSETQPASGRRSYRTQNPTCYYCRIVAQANA